MRLLVIGTFLLFFTIVTASNKPLEDQNIDHFLKAAGLTSQGVDGKDFDADVERELEDELELNANPTTNCHDGGNSYEDYMNMLLDAYNQNYDNNHDDTEDGYTK